MPARLGDSVFRALVGAALFWVAATPVRAGTIPDWLPHYDLGIHLDVAQRKVTVVERVTFTNRHARPAHELVFNVYPRYKLPNDEAVLLAKTLEILRAPFREAVDSEGRHLEVHQITLGGRELRFHFRQDFETALVVPLPRPVMQGQSVTVEMEFTLRLPEKQGRWGHWKGVTFLANWYPCLAYYDDTGWQPTPFVGWHQPYFNEAGVYAVRLTLPADQKFASTGTVQSMEDVGNGFRLVHIVGCCARDFAVVCSDRFVEFCGQAEKARVRVLAFPEHEHLARKALKFACEVIPIYNRWFGTYPYEEFEIVESHFPWNGNECSGIVMIDSRVFAMPHIGERYVDHLITHETLHQWWYNVVGTNGYCETWMDEGVVSYFTAVRLREKYGPNFPLMCYPKGFGWGPNINHEDYRFNGLYGTFARKEETPTIQPLPRFGHLITLFSMTYDRGAKILAMIEERVGQAAFFDFMKLVYSKYQFQVLRVCDFQRELEAYTGRSWEEFFQKWLYGVGSSDWAVEAVEIKDRHSLLADCDPQDRERYQVVVTLRQKAEFTEPTVLGVKFKDDGPCALRVGIAPVHEPVEYHNPPARVEPLDNNRYRVTLRLPERPVQITVDPDQVLVDRNPANNHWKKELNVRLVPLYTPLEETDLTTAHDRWNVIAGPWLGFSGPWFGYRGYAGARVGFYRLQEFQGGVYVAYDVEDQDVRLGADALLMHCPHSRTQIGFQFDHSLTPNWADTRQDRGRLFARYIINYTPSLYMEPIEFVEAYGRIENEFWRGHELNRPGIERYDDLTAFGVRYRRDYRTPYWDPEVGYLFEIGYENGVPILGGDESFNRVEAEFAIIQKLPDGLGYLSQTRLAGRVLGAVGSPDNGEHFQLGGSRRVRGLDRADRQGSVAWVGSLEWRFPLWTDCNLDACDHIARLRHLYGAAFYDVGAIYLNDQIVDNVAHSVGFGLRMDVAWFSFIERNTFRFDVAKVVNDDTGWMFWFGFQHAF